MRKRRFLGGWIAAFVGLVIVLAVSSPARQQPPAPGEGNQILQIQSQVPGFIGLNEEPGVIWLRMQDPRQLADAEAAVRRVMGENFVQGRRFELVDYHPHQIGDWRTMLYQEPGLWTGVSASSYDYQINRIRLDVLTLEAKDRIEAVLQRQQIPRDAVLINVPAGALSEQNPLAGCQLDYQPPEYLREGPYLLEASATQVRPGQTITLAATGGEGSLWRGVDTYLQCWNGRAWSNRFVMLSHGNFVQTVLYSPNLALEQPAFDARSPFKVVIPAALAPGWYRIELRLLLDAGHTFVDQTIQVLP